MFIVCCAHLLAIFHAISCDCGAPGHSRLSFVTESRFQTHTYPENYKVTYGCKAGILVGPSERYCKTGRWSQSIPKCATEFDGRNQYISKYGNDFYLKWSLAAAVVGFKVSITTTHDQTYDDKPNNVNYPTQIETYKETSYIIYYGMPEVDMTRRANITNINVTYAKGSDVTENATFILYVLYHLNEWVDDCDVPDTSLHSTSSMISDSSGIRAEISCNIGFKQAVGSVECPTNGDWESYENVVSCELPTCKNLSISGIEYSPGLVEQRAANGTKAFYKCRNYDTVELGDGHNYVECNESGEWQGKLDPCLGKTGSLVSPNSNSTIVVTIGIVLLLLNIFLITKIRYCSAVYNATNDTTEYVINVEDDIYKPVNVALHLQHFYPSPSV